MRRESVALVVLVWVVMAAGQTSTGDPPSPAVDGVVAEEVKGMQITGEGDKNRRKGGEVAKLVKANEDPKSKIEDLASKKDNKFFLGRFTTTTEIDVVMVTSTVFFSCLSGTSATVCEGRRRKKKLMPLTELHFDQEESHHLDSSQDPDAERMARSTDKALEAPAAGADGKLFLGFQVWTRVRTTSTVTMLFTDTNTTIRLSYYCQAGNIQLPANNCG